MYYNGKKEFYLKQYGIPMLTFAFSLILIGSGIYICWAASTSNFSHNSTIIASNALKNLNENALTDSLEKLEPLQKSEEGTISKINDDGTIVFSFDNKLMKINLLGIDTTNSSEAFIAKMKDDLLNKNAKLSFENEKIINNEIYAYVYINETMSYNEKIIESGLAKLNIDNKLSYKNDLIQAQAYAKQLALGVWKR